MFDIDLLAVIITMPLSLPARSACTFIVAVGRATALIRSFIVAGQRGRRAVSAVMDIV